GDEIVASAHLYGGTYTLLAATLAQLGITVKFVDPTDPENFRAAIGERTKAVIGETIGNPRLSVLDIEAVAQIAHEAGVPLIVDNTFATPFLCRPIEWGADIVVHSATKWLRRPGASIGGLGAAGGRSHWGNGRFPPPTAADPSSPGLPFSRDFGTPAFATRRRPRFLRAVGPAMSPFNALLLLLGVETLPVRMEPPCQN